MSTDYDDLCKRSAHLTVGACTCDTTTPELRFHAEECKYRVAEELVFAIATLREQVATWERRCVEADEDVAKAEAENAALRQMLELATGIQSMTDEQLKELIANAQEKKGVYKEK